MTHRPDQVGRLLTGHGAGPGAVRVWRRWARVAPGALMLAATLASGCAIFPPMELDPAPRFSLDWVRPLYPLEPFAYRPSEPGQALFVDAAGGPSGAGRLVVPTRDRHVRALDWASGRTLWDLETDGPNVGRPALVGGAGGAQGQDLIFGSMDGQLYRVALADGAVRWKVPFPGQQAITVSPTVAGGRVFASSIGNRVAAFDAQSGALLWDHKRPHEGSFTVTGQAGVAVLDAQTVATGFSDGMLVAYGAADGATRWTTDLTGGRRGFVDVDTTPQVVDGVLVAGCYSVGLFGLGAREGEVRWTVKGEGIATPTAFEGMLYAPSADGTLRAIRVDTGEVLWTVRVADGALGPVAVSRRYVLAPTRQGLVLLDRGAGRPVENFRDARGFDAPPVVAWGTVYALANSGLLYSVGLY